jgi:hypothetical protein
MIKAFDLIKHLPRSKTRKWAPRDPADITELVIHQAFSEDSLEDLARYYVAAGNHVDPVGCPSLPYTYAIDRDGKVFQVAALTERTWSLSGQHRDLDHKFISLLVLGDLEKTPPNSAQFMAFFNFLDEARHTFKGLGIHGHCHWGNIDCPGGTLRGIIDSQRTGATHVTSTTLTWGRAQISTFQRAKGLRVTGHLDYDTLRELQKNTA